MKKEGLIIIIVAIFLLIFPFANADVELKETAINNIIIKELSLPATFDITIINNNRNSDIFLIDTLLDINITPKDAVFVAGNSEKTVRREIYPSQEIRANQSGSFSFLYYIKGEKEIKKSTMMLDFISLSDLIELEMPTTISSDEKEINVTINLTKDTILDAELTLVSELLSYTKQVTLTKNGIVLNVPLKSTLPKAGTYEIKATFTIDDYDFKIIKDITLKSIISVEETTEESGYFLNYKTTVTKENTGNSVTDITISLKKSIIAGMFTNFNIKPTNIKREGNSVIYEFTKELNPGEKLTVEARTSYYLPFLILILLIIATWIFIYIMTPQVKINKKAVNVKTKSGVFATKIVLAIKNKGKEVTDLKIIDRLPAFTELVPEKFGTLSPTEIRKKTLIWHIDRLGQNEEIMLSYIVYSKLTIIGTLSIPLTFVTYKDTKGNLHEAKSNSLSIIVPEQSPIGSTVIK
ncbi:MAG: hypothetical protein QW041_02580 [Candidatus Pacearchaeota archaeon]